MFHEFGHALHALLTRVDYPRLAGTNVPTDFVEFPSQFNEHWALEPTVLAHYAKHYQTGQPMPRALVDKIRRARTFDPGFAPPNTSPQRCWTWRGTPCRGARRSATSTR